MGFGRNRASAGGAAIAFVLSLCFVSVAIAAPSHPALSDPIGGYPLNHACGTAVDSEGDIYVSNAGESKVEVFGPSGAHLTSISDASEPCGLAVDSAGNLYVSEAATGEVVRFHPITYPFAGTPSYESPTTVDSSGNARGIAVESADGSLYVAEGTRVAIYKSDGSPFTGNEVQALEFPGSPSGGTYKLSFEGSETAPIAFNASSAAIQAALEGLPTIGAGNVAVGSGGEKITFVGALAATNVPQIGVDASTLVGSTAQVTTKLDGFDGHLEGGFSDATGVASYTSPGASSFGKRRYVSVADAGSDEIRVFRGKLASGAFEPGTLKPGATIDGSETPTGELGFATGGAYLGVDPEDGHLFSFDAANGVVDEFKATGRYFTRVVSAAFEDTEPTAIAVDRSGGANEGDVYVTAGASAGAKLLAFGPVAPPSRQLFEEPHAPHSFAFSGACGAAVNSEGDFYVAGESVIRVYDPNGTELTHIDDSSHPCWLAVDSEGSLYAVNLGASTSGDESVVRYEPNAYPFSGPPTYTEAGMVETINEPRGVTVDPIDDHVFVTHLSTGVKEYKSAAEGSGLLDANFCGIGASFGIDVDGTSGDVYVASGNAVTICNPDGTKQLGTIDGSGSPDGPFVSLINIPVAVDQTNGDVLVGAMKNRGDVEEYEPSGAFVTQFGPFSLASAVFAGLAVDNSSKSTRGNLYVAYDGPTGFDFTAFGPLTYGEPPVTRIGTATDVGGGSATLRGTVEPRGGTEVTECEFEYLTDAQYISNGETFAGAESEECAESAGEIGTTSEPVPVHAGVGGLDPSARYRFRLLAANKFGQSEEAEAGLFGPPVPTTGGAQPVLYTEATLHGEVDSSGLATEYSFQYLTQAEYEAGGESFAGAESTSVQALPASNAGPAAVEADLTGLGEGVAYRYRLVATNEAATEVAGEGKLLTTLEKPPVEPSCPNAQLRTGPSAALPDCRAYEMVSPAEMGSLRPIWPSSTAGIRFSLAAASGDSVVFMTTGTLPGVEAGNGVADAYRVVRGPSGWTSSLFSPSSAQTQGVVSPGGVSVDQAYSTWDLSGNGEGGSLDPPFEGRAAYIRRPSGLIEPSCTFDPASDFELIGCGKIGATVVTDPEVKGRWIAKGAAHLIFSTENKFNGPAVQLEPAAAPTGTPAVYDRTPDGVTHVLSLKPAGGSFGAGEAAAYLGVNEAGTAVAFRVGNTVYLSHDDAETIEIAEGAATFAGISDDGNRVFYAATSSGNTPATLYACNVAGGPCAGAGAHAPTEIAPNAIFVNVSADGSHVYYASGGDLHVWDAADETTHAIGTLAAADLTKFGGTADINLARWTASLDPAATGGVGSGPAADPSRSSPDGRFLVFESHANLTTYDAKGQVEVYRYDAGDESLVCVSCSPTGAPAGHEALLHSFEFGLSSPVFGLSTIQNVTDDGQEVFFETADPLLPSDRNEAVDVYEWKEQGAGEPPCKRTGGCLALISSGRVPTDSFLYSMTPDGHDVFFTTGDALLPPDEEGGGPTLYDARVGGGFPAPESSPGCQGEACQPPSGSQPNLPAPASAGVSGEKAPPPPPATCPKGSRKVRKAGKVRCVKRHKHHVRHGKHRRGGRKAR
jgi:hypothetical protein